MSIQLRSELPGDEQPIDVVNCRAFGEMDEANIVRLMRENYPLFDRRYSITAWDGDQLVGHALFTPARVRLTGQTVAALAVGPVSVLPERQRSGVGDQLLRFGHQLGKAEGFALSLLYGHPTYYPRHGYKACFGTGRVKIDTDKLPEPTRKFRCMPVRPADIPWLVERYEEEWSRVDLAWMWGTSLTEWTGSYVNAIMWWTDLWKRAAYTVARPGRNRCNMILAEDPDLAREVLATIRPKTLEHHPSGWLARYVLDPKWATVTAEPSPAAMARELQEGVLQPYISDVDYGDRPPGFSFFPLPFMAW